MNDASEFLVNGLQRLSRFPLNSPLDVAAWDEQAADVQTELERRFPDFELPHFIHHYFTDSDIRARDVGYRERQERLVAEYIATIRHEKIT